MTLSLPPCPPGVGAAVWRLAWAATVRTLLRGAHWRLIGAAHDGDPQWAAYLTEPSAA